MSELPEGAALNNLAAIVYRRAKAELQWIKLEIGRLQHEAQPDPPRSFKINLEIAKAELDAALEYRAMCEHRLTEAVNQLQLDIPPSFKSEFPMDLFDKMADFRRIATAKALVRDLGNSLCTMREENRKDTLVNEFFSEMIDQCTNQEKHFKTRIDEILEDVIERIGSRSTAEVARGNLYHALYKNNMAWKYLDVQTVALFLSTGHVVPPPIKEEE